MKLRTYLTSMSNIKKTQNRDKNDERERRKNKKS